MNQNTPKVVMQLIQVFRDSDIDSKKIARDNDVMIVRTALHSFVRAVYCYARNVTPGAFYRLDHFCKHVDRETGEINCGYVIGYAVYKWVLHTLEPSLVIHDQSTGCSFMHERDSTKAFVDQIIDFLKEEIPNPRKDRCFIGIRRVKLYVENVLLHYATARDQTPLLYEKQDEGMPDFKEILVYKLDKVAIGHHQATSEIMKIILTRDIDLFDDATKQEQAEEKEDY